MASIDVVEDITPRAQYTAAAAQTAFPYPFPIFDQADLVCYVGSSLRVLGSDYTVAGVGARNGGTLTFTTPLAGGEVVTLYRETAIERVTDFQQNGPGFTAALNDELDRITIVQQELKSGIGRSLRLPVTASTTDAQQELSPISAWLGKFLRISAAGVLEAAELVSSIVPLTQSLIGQLLNPQTDAEAAAAVTPTNYWHLAGRPKRYGVAGNGVTNDTAALLRMIAAMPASGGQIYFDDGAVYMVDSVTLNGLNFSGKTNFKIFGNNATIKVLSGQSVVGGFGMVYFTNSRDGYIENLVIDANRAGRTPANVGAWGVCIQDSTARLHFKNVRVINGVSDGWTVNTSDEATLATYPTDITIEDCVADNCWRNGISVIGSLRLTIDGGSYSNTNGGSPETGIDVEPDVGFTHGNRDLVIRNVRVRGNDGKGIVITGPNASPNVNITIINPLCDSNDKGHIHVAQATNVQLHGGRYGDLVGHASFGAVQFGDPSGTVRNISVHGLSFGDLGTAVPPACLRITGDVAGRVTVADVDFSAIDCRALILEANAAVVNGLNVLDCSGSNPAIQISGSRTRLRNVLTDTTEAAGVYVTGSDVELDGVTVIDFGANASAGIQLETGASGSILRNISLHQRTSIPVGAFGIRYNGVVPRIIQDVAGKSAGTDFTAATLFSFVSGISGSYISDCRPDPLRATTTWDPASIANGAATSQTFTVTGAALGDSARAAFDSSLQGLSCSAYVSAANTITVALANNTGAPVDIANSNVVVWVDKR